MVIHLSRLTGKQRAFVREYVKDFNGTQAAIRAGYSPKSANVIAAENLAKPSIQAELSSILNKAEASAILTYEQACEILTRKAMGTLADYRTANGAIDEEALRTRNPEAVQSVDMFQLGDGDVPATITKLRLCDSIRAVELLAKLRGWNAPEKHEHAVVFRDPEHEGI
jgi:phage terminase small subunit